MHYEGPRRKGRFIKKGAKVLEKVSLLDFRFQELVETKLVTHDNMKRTIIHSQYHGAEELAEGVVEPVKFNDELVGNEQKRPVIHPTDFTAEWERTKKMRKDRIARADEDEFDYEYEAAQRAAQEQERLAIAIAPEEPAAPAARVPPPKPAAAPPRAAPAGGTGGPTPPQGNEKQFEYMDAMGQVIKSFSQGAPDAAAAPDGAAARHAAEFIPTAATGAGVQDPEASAAREYRQRLTELAGAEARLAETAAQVTVEAKAEGYRDGFRLGEEKAELAVRQNAAQVFGKVTELIQEFAKLKHEVLDNVQQNFYELCQAMAEALLKREFSVAPETFVAVMRRAIAEAVEPGKFRIRVHPEFYDKVCGLAASETEGIREALVRDADIPPGDFKIEAQHSIVDVSVTKMISELLAKADLGLFDVAAAAS